MADEELHEVHFICSERWNTEAESFEYLVKWKGWNKKFNTWEPEDSIVDKDPIKEYRSKKKPKKKTAPTCGNTPTKTKKKVRWCPLQSTIKQLHVLTRFCIVCRNRKSMIIRKQALQRIKLVQVQHKQSQSQSQSNYRRSQRRKSKRNQLRRSQLRSQLRLQLVTVMIRRITSHSPRDCPSL